MSSLQWRDENRAEPRSFGGDVTIGSGRLAATGYLAHSQRVGPGVLVLAPALDDAVRALADRCLAEGFTALAPDLTGEDPAAIAREAAEMLVANWHPRVGVLALRSTETIAVAVAERITPDALIVSEPIEMSAVRIPTLVAEPSADEGLQEAFDFLTYHLS
jgi:hypothetical protein